MHEHKARGLVSRRTVLWGALAGAAAVAGFGATLSHQDELGQVDPSVLRTLGAAGTGATTKPGSGGTVRVERVFSAHRNREVDLVTMSPQADRSGLPVCLLLHGRFGTARNAAPGALPSALAAAVARGQVPPFAFVAVDGGGNNYWHAQPGDNPMGMLLDDLPGWLAERGLGGGDGLPFAVAGISMGGFGSLLYTRRRQERGRPVRAVAAISPALITSWPEMHKRKAFRDNAEWESMNPLRHIDKLGSARVGLWCGTEDSFIDGSRQFIRQARPLVGSTGPGRHDSTYFDRVSPDMVRFIGRHLPSV
ncbi:MULTISPECIES: alpha/beta hydrolase family protein [unclassified Crossiella]|uniref:alpha/beta hydrolase n=1 Tax=unclassified Crossiella TaxID=2620835 RepID=UPI001FFE6CA8|nr:MULTISPECIES: alpha/beta hydrolase-fold protein [unclassified Crossiella]MCK2241171.1 esterase family protein [Crossiella sp. S99.2]MCK2253685.1 esterase family protein [Crossiella sp. S99.1]